jgi:NADH:ubiquinone oxidoreductase subunit E
MGQSIRYINVKEYATTYSSTKKEKEGKRIVAVLKYG